MGVVLSDVWPRRASDREPRLEAQWRTFWLTRAWTGTRARTGAIAPRSHRAGRCGARTAATSRRSRCAPRWPQGRLTRPASLQCHFLAVGEFAPVELRVVRSAAASGRSPCASRCRRTDARWWSRASGWWTTGSPASRTTSRRRPPCRRPPRCAATGDLAGEEYAQWYPIWRSIEGRPLRWREPPGRPEWQTWLRFTETEVPGPRRRTRCASCSGSTSRAGTPPSPHTPGRSRT